MKKTEDEIIRNCFTKYVETALNRARHDYMKKEQKRNAMEIMSEPDMLIAIHQEAGEKEEALLLDIMDNIPWNCDSVGSFLREFVGERMLTTLLCLTNTELLIVFAKVFRQMTFVDIAERLGIHKLSCFLYGPRQQRNH